MPLSAANSVGFGPALPTRRIHFQRHIQIPHRFHERRYQFRSGLQLIRRALEHDFVVHRQQQGGLHLLTRQGGIHIDHGQLDQVGGGTLDGGVYGRALGKLAYVAVGADDIGQGADTAQQGADLLVFARLGDRFFNKAFDALVALEIAVDIVLGHLLADFEGLGQAEGAHPVDNPKIDHLGLAAQVVVDKPRQGLEDFRGSPGMDVFSIGKGLDQDRVARAVGQQAQFNLAVIGRHQRPALAGHERLPDPAAFLGTDRDVLEIGVGAAQPAGGRHGLVEGCVDPAGIGIHQLEKGICIGGFEFGQGTVPQHQGGQFVLFRQGRQDFHIR